MVDIKKFSEYRSDNKEVKTKIISAFPGTGKSTFFKENGDICIDSDSSNFSWIVDAEGNKERNPEFPKNYIQHIKDNIGKYEYIFVSSHDEVRNMLFDNCIFFYLVYPSIDRKDEFLERYKNRGNDDSFIALLSKNWTKWLSDINMINDGCSKYELTKGMNISDFIVDRFVK